MKALMPVATERNAHHPGQDLPRLALVDMPAPPLRSGQVRIRARASGVNRADLAQLRGTYPPPPGESDIVGLEVSGTVIETSSSSRFRVGEPVMALLGGGGYAQEVCVDEGLVMSVPKGVPLETAAGIPEVFLTAFLNLFEIGELRPGQRALIHAGASGVGTAAIQLLARETPGNVFATAGTREKAAVCERLGAKAFVYREGPFDAWIDSETKGEGVSVILDPVGGATLDLNMRSLATDGTLILIAFLAGRKAEIDLGRLLSRRLRVRGSTLRSLPLERKRALVAHFEQACLPSFAAAANASGGLPALAPVIDSVYPVHDVERAHARMAANENIGKILLVWPDA